MREHQITNGVFKLEFLERPSQEKEIYSHMFLRISKLGSFSTFKIIVDKYF